MINSNFDHQQFKNRRLAVLGTTGMHLHIYKEVTIGEWELAYDVGTDILVPKLSEEYSIECLHFLGV